MLVDKFWERNCLLNDRIIGTAVSRRSAFSPRRDGNGERLGLVSLDVEATSTDELIRMFLSTLKINGDLK
jgi:hypothetical protein